MTTCVTDKLTQWKLPGGEEFNVTIYVPCHFDFSQLEFVAPFLARNGGKVFIYNWNPHKTRMFKLFKDIGVQCFPFTLEALVRNISQEKKKVVFLLTGAVGLNYSTFGNYQVHLFDQLKSMMPDRVHGVSVIGHCMYGCSSCTGAEHKVPVYLTRWFMDGLGYSVKTESEKYRIITRQQAKEQGKALTVLVCPSTETTSIMCQPEIVQRLWQMQQRGTHRFVWKFHPCVFNTKEYDLNYPPHVIELANIKFIMEHMEYTPEVNHVMLPYMEAFDVIVCDLHSTVAFIALYFAPKTIIAYENDSDYGTPDRAPEFLASLNLFDTPDGLEKLLTDIPAPRGNRSFFTGLFGNVDGTEDLRFGRLAKWPKGGADVKPNAALTPVELKQMLKRGTLEWGQHFHKLMSEKSQHDEFISIFEAHGIEKHKLPEYTFLEFKQMQAELAVLDAPVEKEAEECKEGCSNNAAGEELRVMSLNMWYGGHGYIRHHKVNLSLEETLKAFAKSIEHAKSDVVLLQEVGAFVTERSDDNTCEDWKEVDISERLAGLLGWKHVLQQGLLCGGRHPHSIISRLPLEPALAGYGAVATLASGEKVLLANVHLPYFPYEPYQLCGIPYSHSPTVVQPLYATVKEVIASATKSRRAIVLAVEKEVKANPTFKNMPLILGGDFNEPSHRDWTALTAYNGTHPAKCEWPTALSFEQKLDLVDCWRERYPCPVEHPGFTWSIFNAPDATHDHRDRLDFLFYKNGSASVSMKLVDTQLVKGDATGVWYSDHFGVLATFIVHKQ